MESLSQVSGPRVHDSRTLFMLLLLLRLSSVMVCRVWTCITWELGAKWAVSIGSTGCGSSGLSG